jgi:transcriptional regulator of acetoin/glycerol metabolism
MLSAGFTEERSSMSDFIQPTVELRPEIRRSWERSSMCGLERASVMNLPFEPDLQAEERFLRAAGPVLESVGGFLDGAGTSAVLIDGRGRVLRRCCPEPSVTRMLDSTQSAPGFSWSEEHAGTTAVSLSLEERMPAIVSGGEHFLDALEHLVCAAAPIIHPVTRRLQGVIDVTSDRRDASVHMMPIVLQASRAIQERLFDDASVTERALLSHFLGLSSGCTRPIVVLGERVELSTPPAARLLGPDDRTLLWERASRTLASGQTLTERFTLSDGHVVSATFSPIEAERSNVGVAVELTKSEEKIAVAPVSRGGSVHGGVSFVGRSTPSQSLRRQVDDLRGELMPVLITGEPGVGKLTLARTLARDGMECVLFDAARSSLESEAALLRELANVAKTPGKILIVRSVGCLSMKALQVISSVATVAEENGSRLVATSTVARRADDTLPTSSMTDSFGLRINISPLRERTDDIVDLVPYMIQRRGATARMAPAAVQALMSNDWPGNARELDSLIRVLLTRKRTTDIVLADLPGSYREGARRLRRIEQVERSAIVHALTEAEGNKTKAAELLEIGRATLYRKMRAYGLDLDVTTG